MKPLYGPWSIDCIPRLEAGHQPGIYTARKGSDSQYGMDDHNNPYEWFMVMVTLW